MEDRLIPYMALDSAEKDRSIISKVNEINSRIRDNKELCDDLNGLYIGVDWKFYAQTSVYEAKARRVQQETDECLLKLFS